MTELTCETPHSPPDCEFAVWSFQPPAGSLIDEMKSQSPRSGLAQEGGRAKQAQELVAEVEKQTVQICIVSTEGRNSGTFSRELLAWAIW